LVLFVDYEVDEGCNEASEIGNGNGVHWVVFCGIMHTQALEWLFGY
jgi:hypothetical protein